MVDKSGKQIPATPQREGISVKLPVVPRLGDDISVSINFNPNSDTKFAGKVKAVQMYGTITPVEAFPENYNYAWEDAVTEATDVTWHVTLKQKEG
jgi:hypothetical protein